MGCGASSAAVGMEGGINSQGSLGRESGVRSANDATGGTTSNDTADPTLSTSGRRLSKSRKTPQMSQFLDKTVAAEWRANHTVSIRANLVQTKKNPITEDFIFDLEKEIGRGGVGAVVVGESKKEKSALYAIKVCDKAAVSVSRLTREVLLLKDVDHVNIVRLFTVYDLPTHMYFVMELCRGGHLGVLLKSKPQERLDEKWARRLCWQLMSAVAHLHERGICHRDVKLQNVLLDTYDVDKAQIKLIDFGYGSRFIGALPMRSKVGTPYTMAPEVLRESYDQRCDVWSVGVVLYIMLSGRRPFEPLDCVGHLTEAGKATMTTNVLSGRYHFDFPSFSDVSDEAKQFVDLLFTQPYMSRLEATEALNEPWLMEQRQSLSLSASLAQDSLSNNVVANMLSNLDSDAPSLRRTGNVAVVFGLQPSEASRMRGVFQTVDTDGSGGLDVGEFTTAMQILCPSLSAEDCGIIFKAVDINGDGQISYTEFLAASLDPRCVDIAELNKAFHLLDANGDGLISAPELQALYHLKLSQSLRIPGQGQGGVAAAGAGAGAGAGAEEEKGIVDDAPADWEQVRRASLSASSSSSSASAAGAGGQELSLSPRSNAVREYLNNIALVNQKACESSRDVSFSILEMMAACDKDMDGFISYEEFIWGMTGSWMKDVLSDEALEKTKTGDLALLRATPSQSDLLAASGISRASQSVRGSKQSERSLPHTPTPPVLDKDKEPPFPPSADASTALPRNSIIGSTLHEGEDEEEEKSSSLPSITAQ